MSDLDPRDEWYSKKKLNRIFAASSIALLLSTGWMVMADWGREWKVVQREFRRIELERFRLERADVREALAASPAYAEALAAKDTATRTARANAEVVAELERKIADLDAQLFVADNNEKLERGFYAVGKSEVEAGRRGNVYARNLAKHLVAADRWRGEKERLEAARRERAAALAEAKAGADAAEERFEAAVRDFRRVRKAVADARWGLKDYFLGAPLLDFMAPPERILQTVPEHHLRDVNFGSFQRVDRCQTCHLGIDKPEYSLNEDGTAFADERTQEAMEAAVLSAGGPARAREARRARYLRLFSAHPRLDLYLSSGSRYPLEKFACTVCHEGNGQATSFVDVVHVPRDRETKERWIKDYNYSPRGEGHGHEMYDLWQWPMLQGKYVEASLQRLERGIWNLPTGREVNRGLILAERYQCYACHKIARADEAGLVPHAPGLKRIDSKLRPEWVYAWLRNPRAIRPATRMPRFFNLENAQNDEDRTREEEEVKALTSYLFARAAQRQTYPAPPAGDAARGRQLFRTVGCMACHRVEAEEESERDNASGRAFGPSLDGVATKASTGWIFAWIRNPRGYDPNSRMPDLRLTPGEAADITSYLATLTIDTAIPSAVPAPNAPVLRRMAYDILRKRRTLEEAKSAAEGMSEPDLVAFVGEAAVGRYGCYSCHAIGGFEGRLPIGAELSDIGRKPIVRFDFGLTHDIPRTRDAWIHRKVTRPRVFDMGKILAYDERSRMPDFGFSDTDARSITTAALGWNEERLHPSLVRRASPAERGLERILSQRGCRSCHIVEGHGGGVGEVLEAKAAPPPLIRQGGRVRAEWLRDFLRDPGAMRVRPVLAIRMPSFDFDAHEMSAVVEGFALRDGVPVMSDPFRADPARAARGKLAFDTLGCKSCHLVGTAGSAMPDVPAPPLGLVRNRMRFDWTREWILSAGAQYSEARKAAGLPDASIMPSYGDALSSLVPSDTAASASAWRDTNVIADDLVHYLYTL